MKNLIKNIGSIIFIVIFISCSNNSKFEGNFSGDELKAVKITEKSLPRGAKIEDIQVVKEKLPLALMETEYKSVRDRVYKARLDYRACMTRGLNAAAQKNAETLVEIQNIIREKAETLESASPQYLFVLAKTKERASNNEEKLFGYIAVFDSNTLEKVDFMPVTTPLYNNAVMIAEALNGTLSNPSSTGDSESLKIENPVVQFIVNCTPK